MNRAKLALVSCGFLGCSPLAPRAAGSLGGVLIAFALAQTSPYLLWSVLACVAIYAIGRALGEWAQSNVAPGTPNPFVLGEVIGYLITVQWLRGPSLLSLALAFFVFRLIDTMVSPPARFVEALGGSDALLLGGVLAGLVGWVVMISVRALLLTPADWFVS